MPSSEPALRACHLFRSFGNEYVREEVLHDVSLELFAGQVLLLIGPSGSGKSTLLAVLSGLLRPDQGEVLVHGENLWGWSELAREEYRRQYVSFIFQSFNLFPSLTAREQLEMVLRWGEGVPRQTAKRRVVEMLDQLELVRHGGRATLQRGSPRDCGRS